MTMKKKTQEFPVSKIQAQLEGMALRYLMASQPVRGIGDDSYIDDADTGKKSYAMGQIAKGQKREAERTEQMAYDMQVLLIVLDQLSVQIGEHAERIEEQETRVSQTERRVKKVKKRVKKQEKLQIEQRKNLCSISSEQQKHSKALRAMKECFSVIGMAAGGKYGASLKSVKNNLERRLSLSDYAKFKEIPMR